MCPTADPSSQEKASAASNAAALLPSSVSPGTRAALRLALENASPWDLTYGLHKTLGVGSSAISLPQASQRLAQTEVEIARVFNQSVPHSPVDALDRLEEAISEVMSVRQQLILWALPNGQEGYYCLNDERQREYPPREVLTLDDETLTQLLGTSQFLQTPLSTSDNFYGLLLVSNKDNGAKLTLDDQMTLDILAPYVMTQVQTYCQLRDTGRSPFVQEALLKLSGRLVGLVDTQAILNEALSHLLGMFGCQQAQYIQWHPDNTAISWVSLELKQQQGDVLAPTEGVTSLPEGTLTHLISLLQSKAWGKHSLVLQADGLRRFNLYDTPVFRGANAALFVPIRQKESGHLLGLMTFLSFEPLHQAFPKTLLMVAEEAAPLVSAALERAAVLDQALLMANRDELTGLANRRLFYERFELELTRVERTDQPLSIAMLDVDHFKQLNDAYGHLSGDVILSTLADVLKTNTRKLDTVARFGGEEFVLLLPNTTMEAATELMERLREKIEQVPFKTEWNNALQLTVSIGVAQVWPPVKEATEDEVYTSETKKQQIALALSAADEALYQAKHAGRNQVCRAAG